MIKLSGTTRRKRIISFFLLIIIVSEIVTPTATYALTGGPSQPEVQAFTPVSTAEMVDLTSGDFKYNIPLMDVGGYPLNIAYNSGIGMDQEASWTGLGWNLNVGSINRNMRGLPDDFNGEVIEKEFNMKDNNTYGVTVGVGLELFGYQKQGSSNKTSGKLNVGLGINYNNYTGIGMEQSASIGISAGNPSKGTMNSSLGMKSSNSGGLTITPNLSFSAKTDSYSKNDETTSGSASIGIGMSMNSRAGLKDLSVNASYNRTTEKNTKLYIPTMDGGYVTGFQTASMSSSQSGGVGSAGIINFGASTFIPRIQNNMVNNSVAVSFKLGTTIFGLDGDITMGGYFSNQSLKDPYTSTAAYGYMFSHVGQNSDNVLMDFNREKDQAFSRYTKNLPITNQTYDVFSVTGQGIGGAFRPFRSDVGYVFDNKSTNTSDSYSAGAEFAGAQTAHLGVNISVVDVNTVAGKWDDDNDAKGKLYARGSSTANLAYEPYYFKEVGEKSADNVQKSLYNSLGAGEAYRFKIDKLVDHRAMDVLEKWQGGPTLAVSSTNHITQRQKRNQVLSSLSLAEARDYGFDKSLYSGGTAQVSSQAKDHHIAEITALRVDGSRYIYGLPAYNKSQEEITFNCSSGSSLQNGSYNNANGYVSYGASDISTSNSKGVDHYYNRIKTPAYAHSYLLTAIVSPDYVDVSNNGPDDSDFGNYTKFEYEKLDNVGWRMPYDGNKANFNENGKSMTNDDQANFVYGQKELWFVKKIITRNYVAVFKLGNRHDALSANDVNGGQGAGSVKTKYLESVSLYSKPEYDADPTTNKTNAVPIKVVHFVYDYSLCPGVPNNDGIPEIVNGSDINVAKGKGKLTLKEIYFTYGKSDKAKFSKYKFDYGQILPSTSLQSNFAYHPKAYDRWGNYMPINNNPAAYNNNSITSDYAYNSVLNNSEYPYVDQFSKADADFRASAWNLTKIQLPSGATVKINYESDDYAFVQNRPAMQMMKVIGIANTPAITSLPGTGNLGNLYTGTGNNDQNQYLFFELTEPLSYSTPLEATALVRQHYLKDINSSNKYLYFRFLANLTNTSGITANVGNYFEYVSGYAELDGLIPTCGVVQGGLTSNGHQVGYVKVGLVKRDDKTALNPTLMINPIAKAVLNFGKSHYNNLVWDASFAPPSDVVGALKQLASEATGGPFKTIMQAIKGPNNSLMGKNYGCQFVIGKSWIRLYNPNGHKFGGGSRVKELSIDDNWNLQTIDNLNPNGQANSVYGQEFSYETVFMGRTVSSGVASYEPMLGGDENPFRQPVFMGPNKFTMLIPDERFFMEEPFGETFFPSASVSYSKVKVKNKIPSTANVKTHGTGYVVHEFYTAKDYPTLTTHTPINPKQYKPPLGGLLKVMSRDYLTASQGYVIKLNDMHGKQKAQSVYAEGSNVPMSKVEYVYKTKGANGYTEYNLRDMFSDASCTPNELDNSCVVINQKGKIGATTIGMDFDAVADFRETQTTSIMGGAQINLSMFLVGVFPGIVPSIWPDFSYEKTRFRSAVLTKVISNYGILEKTTAQDNGSSVTTSNLAYDAQTGDVLVTRTKNDFHDDIYSLKYPAFWGYDLMGPAYKNIGYSENMTFSGGVAAVASPDFYNIGDELALGGGNVGWVCNINYVLKEISVIDASGNQSISGNKTIKVLRSGRRNLLGAQMASLTSLVNPIDYGNDGIDTDLNVRTVSGSVNPADDRDYKILNTSAIQYSDQWQTFKGYSYTVTPPVSCSLYDYGIAFQDLVTGLVNADKLKNPSTLVYNSVGNISYYGFNQPAFTSGGGGLQTYPSAYEIYINTGIVNPTTLNFSLWSTWVGHGTGNNNPCVNGSFILPAGMDWNAIKFTSISSVTAYTVGAVNRKMVFCGDYVTPPSTVTAPACFTLSLVGQGSCWLSNCNQPPPYTVKCGVVEGDKVNPFRYGIKGNWRPKTTWSYLEDRAQTTPVSANNLDIRKDGHIPKYYPFYDLTTSGTWTANPTYWNYTSEISKYTPNGAEVENKDALARYSSALYGYKESLPVAVASNARLQEIAYDGFEDYSYNSLTCNSFSKEHHFDFFEHRQYLDNQQAHTGKYSMKVNPLTDMNIQKSITSQTCTPASSPICSYTLSCGDFIYPFSPISSGGAKKYILSYWVKEATAPSVVPALTYTNSFVSLSVSGSGSVGMGSLKKSDIIDGWQRFEREFTISSGATGKLSITLSNTNSTVSSYFDDIRIHPFNSNMKSFVYDPVTLKYVAELDANNFATFYEYDEEGSLVRVKKETEKGIMTIQETKNHTKR